MNNYKRNGFAFLPIIIAISVLALVGLVGYTFWKKMNLDQTSSTSKSQQDSSSGSFSIRNSSNPGYKIYTIDKLGMSFEYPSDWEILSSQINWNNGSLRRSADIMSNLGHSVAYFDYGPATGQGSTCPDEDRNNHYTILSVEETNLPMNSTMFGPTYFVAGVMEYHNATNDSSLSPTNFRTTFGLMSEGSITDSSNEKNTDYVGKTRDMCIYNYTADVADGVTSGDYSANEIAFGYAMNYKNDVKTYSTYNEAKAYYDTDEYKAIKKMILSLKYTPVQ